MKVLSLGSVIQLREQKFYVAGYQPVNKEGAVALSYILLPYPYGYLSKEKIFLCPVSKVDTVVAEGYRSERGGHYLELLEAFEEKGKDADYKEFVTFMKEAKKNLAKQEAAE